MNRLPTVCPCCGKPGYVWDVLTPDRLIPLPLEHAYAKVCNACKHPAKVDPNTPIQQVRVKDDERKLHQRRRTGQRAARHVGRG